MNSNTNDSCNDCSGASLLNVGSRVAVYWSGDEEYYEGSVVAKRRSQTCEARSALYEISYDDGDQGLLDPSKNTYRVLPAAAAAAAEAAASEDQLEVGCRLSVYWPVEKEFYFAKLQKIRTSNNSNHNGKPKPHFLLYDDGDEEWTNLRYRKFKLVKPKTEDSVLSQLQVGARLSVYWPLDKKYYTAILRKIDDGNNRNLPHFLVYNDGDKEWTNLKYRKLELLPPQPQPPPPPPVAAVENRSYQPSDAVQVAPNTHRKKKIHKTKGPQPPPPLPVAVVEKRRKDQTDRPSDDDRVATNKHRKKKIHKKKGKETVYNTQSNQLVPKKIQKKKHQSAALNEESLSANQKDNSEEEQPTKRRKKMTFEEHFQELKAYYEKFRHSNIKTSHPTLGRWVAKIRSAGGRQRMTEDQRNLLNSVEFDFRTQKEKFEEMWHSKFAEYKRYIRKNPDGSPSDERYFSGATSTLRSWISSQQENYKAGCLREDRQNLLEEAGFLWVRKESLSGANNGQYGKTDKWDKSFATLQEFRNKMGHTLVQPEDDEVLWRWVNKQRLFQRQGTLKQTRIELLDSIGFVWENDVFDSAKGIQQQTWDGHFHKILDYFNRNGHSNVRRSENLPLHQWLGIQRQMYDKGKLHPSRLKELQRVDFVPNTRVEKWNELFRKLLVNKEKHGRWYPTGRQDDELSEFVKRLRSEHTRGILWPNRQKALEDAGFVFHPYDEQWSQKFNQLEALHNAKGTGDISLTEYTEAGLDIFVTAQRALYRGKRNRERVQWIQPERKALLDSIGFVWEGRRGPKPRDDP